MYVFNRDSHFIHGDATMSHWLDIENAFRGAYSCEAEEPEVFCIISDNGSGYDPVCPRNAHYAKMFMDRHKGIKVMVLLSFAAGESARNFEIERAWAAFMKKLIGIQLGVNCLDGALRGPNGALRGPKNEEERKALFEAACTDLKWLWDDICISETETTMFTPNVVTVAPYTEECVDEARRIHKFYMKNISRDEIEKTKDLRLIAQEVNELSSTTFNETWIYAPKYNTERFKKSLFGASGRNLYPEEDKSLTGVRKDARTPVLYNTFLQRRHQYEKVAQPTLEYDEKCPIPRCEKDFGKIWVTCCDHLFTSISARTRHNRNTRKMLVIL